MHAFVRKIISVPWRWSDYEKSLRPGCLYNSGISYLSSKKQIRPPPSLSAWQRYHSFWHVLLWETNLFSLLFYITFLFELEVQTGFQFFIDFSDSLQNGVYSTTKIRSFSSIKFKFMLLVFFFYILDWKPLFLITYSKSEQVTSLQLQLVLFVCFFLVPIIVDTFSWTYCLLF